MTTTVRNHLMVALVASAMGCGTARSLDVYRTETEGLLDRRSTEIRSCYDDALKTDSKMGGTVTVQFVVAKETGTITGATVDPAKSTAPPVLGQCVIRAIEGLKLDPPDRNEGRATFVYEFKPAPTKL